MMHPEVRVFSVPMTEDDPMPGPAQEVAARAREQMAETHPETVVVIGGDTAAALLGDAPRNAGGMIAPGMPWSRDEHGGGPLVITKAGGFGGLNALVDLFTDNTP